MCLFVLQGHAFLCCRDQDGQLVKLVRLSVFFSLGCRFSLMRCALKGMDFENDNFSMVAESVILETDLTWLKPFSLLHHHYIHIL